MNIAVRYYTRSGNTKKLAEAVASAVGAEALETSVELAEKVDLLFLGSSLYAGNMDANIKDFIDKNADKIGKIACFGSSAMGKSTHGKIKAYAEQKGIEVAEDYFNCPGKFLFMHGGRPDARDLSSVKTFAKAFLE